MCMSTSVFLYVCMYAVFCVSAFTHMYLFCIIKRVNLWSSPLHECQVVCHWVASVAFCCKRAGRGRDGGAVGGNRRREGVIE